MSGQPVAVDYACGCKSAGYAGGELWCRCEPHRLSGERPGGNAGSNNIATAIGEPRVRSEDWVKRAPTQRDRILADLRVAAGAWVCAIIWNQTRILRYGARIWELRHEGGHEIEERMCAAHHVAEYRLTYDAAWDREPVQ